MTKLEHVADAIGEHFGVDTAFHDPMAAARAAVEALKDGGAIWDAMLDDILNEKPDDQA
jgi:hypothetical protein